MATKLESINGDKNGGSSMESQGRVEQFWQTVAHLKEIIKIGISFFLVFTMYATVQNYQTTVNKENGYLSLAVLYCTFCVSSLLAPAFVKRFPPKPLLIFASATYVLYVVASIWVNIVTLLAASVLIGIGASVLWTTQGTFITLVSEPANLGRNHGVFWAVWVFNMVVGNLFAAVFLLIYDHPRVVFMILAVVGTMGMLSFLLLVSPSFEPKPISFTTMTQTLTMFVSRKMLLLALYICYFGARGAFIWGKLAGTRIPSRILGFCFACNGVAEVIGGSVLGRVSDTVGRRIMVFCGFVLEMISLAAATFATTDRLWLFFVLLVAFGFSDAALQTQLNAILSTLQQKRTQAAFGFKNCMQALTSGIIFFVSPSISFEATQLILIALLVAGVTSLFLLDRFVCSVDPQKKQPQIAEQQPPEKEAKTAAAQPPPAAPAIPSVLTGLEKKSAGEHDSESPSDESTHKQQQQQ